MVRTDRRAGLGVITAALATSWACGPPEGESVYHVVSAGMRLPVVEMGQRDAEVAVLHVHGGPGESRLDTRLGAEVRLAEAVLYVTWAQRTTPFATGNLRPGTATLAQHVEDLSAVLATVHHRHPDKRVVLTGFSWGGAVTVDYLSRAPAPYVAGVVLVGALIDARRAIDDSWAMLRTHAEARIAARATNASYWASVGGLAARYADAIDTLSPSAYLESFVRPRITACGRMRDDLDLPDNVENERKNVYEWYHLLPIVENVAVEWMVDEILAIDLRARLPSINRPALVLWGDLDCNVPLPTADLAFDELGSLQKTRLTLSNVPHDVLDAAPAAYAEAVLEFIDDLPQ